MIDNVRYRRITYRDWRGTFLADEIVCLTDRAARQYARDHHPRPMTGSFDLWPLDEDTARKELSLCSK